MASPSPWATVGATQKKPPVNDAVMPPQSLPPAGAPQTASLPPATVTSTNTVQPVSPTLTGQATQGAPKPANDLRSTTFSPTPSEGTQQATGYTNTLAQRMAQYTPQQFTGTGTANYSGATNLYGQAHQAAGGAATPYNVGTDTNQVRNTVMDRFMDAQAPNRMDLAGGLYDMLERQSRPAWEAELRTAGQKNASLGRLGSGMMTTQLADITDARQQRLADLRYQLANDAAGKTLDDNLNMIGAGQGLLGQMGGEDRANYGAGLEGGRFNLERGGFMAGLGDRAKDMSDSLWQQQTSERDKNLAYGLDTQDLQSRMFGQFAGLEGQRFGQDMAGRNEMRTERDFQAQQAQQGIDNAARQRAMEEQFFGNDYTRWLQGTQAFGGMGFGGDPSGAQLGAAGQYGQQAQQGMDAAGQLGQNWSYMDWARKNGMIVN